MLFSKPMLRKVLGLVAECWPSLQSHSAATLPPCQQHRLFPAVAGWHHLRLLGFRCLNESHLGYEFEITLESEQSLFNPACMLELQPQNSYSKIALWLTQQQLTGCQTVSFQAQQVPLCQALAAVELINTGHVAAANLSEWLTRQGLMPRGRFKILHAWQHGSMAIVKHCTVKQQIACRALAIIGYNNRQFVSNYCMFVIVRPAPCRGSASEQNPTLNH